MSEFINHNGDLKKAGNLLFAANHRAFRYGDGLFETIRVFAGEIPFLKLHYERLLKGLDILQFEIPEAYSLIYFKKEIQKLINHQGNHRVRLSIFRSGAGLYTPENNQPEFLIESAPLGAAEFIINQKGLKVGIYDKTPLQATTISHLKTNNALPYILTGIYAKKHRFDDCFLLNTENHFVESISSNIFVIKDQAIFTPLLSGGCVAGTMRRMVIQMAQRRKFEIKEIKVSLSHLKNADEIWLTNAIQGIRWVEFFENRQYGNPLAVQFVKYLNDSIKA